MRMLPSLLLFLAIVTFWLGSRIVVDAKSVFHEMEAYMLFQASAIFITGASIVAAINGLRKETIALKRMAGFERWLRKP